MTVLYSVPSRGVVAGPGRGLGICGVRAIAAAGDQGVAGCAISRDESAARRAQFRGRTAVGRQGPDGVQPLAIDVFTSKDFTKTARSGWTCAIGAATLRDKSLTCAAAGPAPAPTTPGSAAIRRERRGGETARWIGRARTS